MANLSVSGTIAGGGHYCSVNSIGDNYIRYDNGVQICFAYTGTFSSIDSKTVTFPVAFSTTDNLIICCQISSGTSNSLTRDEYHSDITYNITTSGFTLRNYLMNGEQGISYIAIGKWK